MTDKNAVRRIWCTKPLAQKVLKLWKSAFHPYACRCSACIHACMYSQCNITLRSHLFCLCSFINILSCFMPFNLFEFVINVCVLSNTSQSYHCPMKPRASALLYHESKHNHSEHIRAANCAGNGLHVGSYTCLFKVANISAKERRNRYS